MNDLPFDCFYLYIKNLKLAIKGKKASLKFCSGFLGKRLDQRIVKALQPFYTKYRSHHFSEKDFQIFFIENLITDSEYLEKFYEWSSEKVSNYDVKNLIKQDEETILKISQKTGQKKLEIYFNVNTNGESLSKYFYDNKMISMFFVAKYSKFFGDSLEETLEHKRFGTLMKILNKVMDS